MLAPLCSSRQVIRTGVQPSQLHLLQSSSFCSPGHCQLSRHVAIRPCLSRRRGLVPLSASGPLGPDRVKVHADQQRQREFPSPWQWLSKGLMLMPLLAAALLAPGAARATFQQAGKPMSESVAAYLDRPRQAKDFQYPAWQRLQWASWGELQLSGEARRRLAAAILASGILLVLAFKLIATNAAHSVLDKPSDKKSAGWKEPNDDGTSGRRRNSADAVMAKGSGQSRTNAVMASSAASTLLGNGVNRGASEPGRTRLEDIRPRADSSTARAAASAAPRPQPVRVQRSPSPPPPQARTGPPPPPKVVSFKSGPGGKPSKSQDEQDTSAPLISEDRLHESLFHGGNGSVNTSGKPSEGKVSTRHNPDDSYDTLFRGDAAGTQAEAADFKAQDMYDPLFHGNAASPRAEASGFSAEDMYDPLFHDDAAATELEATDTSPDIYDPLFHGGDDTTQMAAETVDFPGASLGYQSDIDVMAAEIASGTLSSGALSDSADSSLDQLAAEVVAGRPSDAETASTGRVSPGEAYRRAVAGRGTAASPLAQATGFMRAALALVINTSAAVGASRLHGQGHVLSVQREGQSLTATMRAPVGARDGSTLAERAERAVLSSRRPLASLARGKVAAPERRWAGLEKYDLFHEALSASSAANPDARYNPVRAVLEAVPPRGAQKYDMIQALLQGAVKPRQQQPYSKYDCIWQLLRAGREGGATAAPKFDPVYDLLRAATWVADWGLDYQQTSAFSDWGLVDRYDPVIAFFGNVAPTVRSRWDPFQALLAMEAPTGSSRYDMVGEILAAAQSAPEYAPRSGPVHGAICFLREVVGLDIAPVGDSRFDPLPNLLDVQPAAPTGRSRYDIWNWLRTRSTASSSGTQVIKTGALSTPLGRYDPAAALLGALAGPPPDAPDDPLRLAIRRAAMHARGEAPDMAVGRAFVFRGPKGTAAVPVRDSGEPGAEVGAGAAGGRSWPWRGFWSGGSASGGSSSTAETPYEAQLAATSAPSSSIASAAVGGTAAVNGSTPEADAAYDPVPDLFKLWSALKASSAQLDPLDAVNVIAKRGGGDHFFHVASAYRRLAEDSKLRAKHQPLYALLDGMHGRVLLPKPSAEAIRSARAMLREAGASYSPIHGLLKGRDGAEVVRTMCIMHDLLVAPSAQRAQQPPSQPAPASSQQLAYGT